MLTVCLMSTEYPQNTDSRKPGKTYRISGHESFPCRYAWLPKAVRGLQEDPKLFLDEEGAMVKLGVGKNMVRSIRFWSQVMGMAEAETKRPSLSLTDFGRILLAEKRGRSVSGRHSNAMAPSLEPSHQYRESAIGVGLSAEPLAGA